MKKKMKRIFKALVVLFLVAVIIAVSVNLYVCLSVDSRIYNEKNYELSGEYDAIIVLGCGVLPDGVPTRMMVDRLNTAINLYNSGVCKTLLLSGDHGRDGYDEVNTMMEYALEHGVPKEDIFLDHAGFSTYETMIRASKIFGVKKAIVVTQEYHLSRSVYNAKMMGIDAYGVCATSDPFPAQSYYSVREYMARIKDFVFDIVKPDPTYLGEAIDIHGDSSITFDK